jgi:nitrate reductase beta subunit
VPPACVAQCVGKIRFVGYRDDKDGPIYKLVEQWQVALPLHAEYGTEPNVFYVPPMNTTPAPFEDDGRLGDKPRIPIADLESLFGKGVQPALETLGREMQRRRQAKPSELIEILIGYTNKDRFRL